MYVRVFCQQMSDDCGTSFSSSCCMIWHAAVLAAVRSDRVCAATAWILIALDAASVIWLPAIKVHSTTVINCYYVMSCLICRPKITKLDFKSSTLIIGVVDEDGQVCLLLIVTWRLPQSYPVNLCHVASALVNLYGVIIRYIFYLQNTCSPLFWF